MKKSEKILFALQNKKDKVQSFFRHPEVKYF